jgi:aminopeptidase N
MLDAQRDAAPTPAAEPAATRREDYRPPAWRVETVGLHFDLHPGATRVRAELALRRNPVADAAAPLRLDGEGLRLMGLALDGERLIGDRYSIGKDGTLVIPDLPASCTLRTEVEIDPSANTELSGLYLSRGSYFTQCEAEGFRRITYFPDRPDVMARFTVTLAADAGTCPVLLSNGNPDARGTLPDGRHWARWIDPHPKPSYLFALVAGDLVAVRDRFVTRSGREVTLAIWVRHGDQDRCAHAMHALKQAMRWDEEMYGREYDLDVFNIAAVSDFNMGAMENKGLNVFNTRYVLARPESATDGDYQGIETVVAHEYFHNWTGNRVTCRDWFQLSLKEGLTVFRDQEFTADQGSRAVKRLADVRRLRAAQFPEDDGPLAHPVRPDSYIAIDNFYTATVYQKGAEVVRMLHTLAGPAGFRRGMDLYFERHDNQAVTIEDFVRAIGDGAGIDLSAFLRWYAQAGTPELTVGDSYDPAACRYTLTLHQRVPPTPGQKVKQPVPIPVAMALLGPDGHELPGSARVLLLTEERQDFTFDGIAAPPVPSLLRGFSAPVKLLGVPRERLRFLAAHDTDPFVRWDSLHAYATGLLLDLVRDWRGTPPALDGGLLAAMRATLDNAGADPAFAAEALVLPSEAYIADQMATADPDAVHAARQALRAQLGAALHDLLRETYDRLADRGPYRTDGAAIGRRALRNACLAYLAAAGAEGVRLARAQFDAQANMTDVLAALDVLAATEGEDRTAALAAFHARWRGDDLVLDKWFAIQAASPRAATLAEVRALYRHPDFDLRNPNRVRALVGAFAANQVRFHAASGEGYRFLADVVIALDPLNGQTAARLVNPLGAWRRQDAARAGLMQAELARILATPRLSRGTYEKASKGLA